MINRKEELLDWLKESKSQWVFDEVAKIKVSYEKRASALSEIQKNVLTRRLQLHEWGRLDFKSYRDISKLKIAEGVEEDLQKIQRAERDQMLEEAFHKISDSSKPTNSPKSVRAFIVDGLEACIYYIIKNKEVLVIGVFLSGEHE